MWIWLVGAHAMDCTGKVPETCAAVDAVQELVNTQAGSAVIHDGAASRLRPAAIYDRLEAFRQAVGTGCRADGLVPGHAGGLYHHGSRTWSGAFDLAGSGATSAGTGGLNPPARAFAGTVLAPAATRTLGGGFSAYATSGHLAADLDLHGVVGGAWIRTSGSNGVWVARTTTCDGGVNPSDALEAWYPGELPAGPTASAVSGLLARPANPTCLAPAERLAEDPSVTFTRVFTASTGNLVTAVAITQAPGSPDHWYAVEQRGTIKRWHVGDTVQSAQVLNIGSQVTNAGERGLLGLAFHPDFQINGYAYLNFVDRSNRTRVVRIQTSGNGASWDATSMTNILTVQQPAGNHNGGHLAFGPDGYLYVGLGDGGGGGDPYDNAQDLGTLLGSMLRIDVDGPAPYGIPADNPFVGISGVRPEIWAYGLRNPWRYSFDPMTGDLWLGDVGQNAVEEVNIIRSGGNYGWPIREGSICYGAGSCEHSGLIDPIFDYLQNPGYAVMGGVVYRGTMIPEMVGTYVFGDHASGQIFALTTDPETGEAGSRVIGSITRVVHFENGLDGELYVLDRQNRRIYRMEPTPAGPVQDFPRALSETGCVDPSDPTVPADAMIPYELNHPFWSDGADKSRWMAIPDGETIAVDADGDLELPVGSMLMKEFVVDGHRVETRLFMHHEDGWSGYTYAWRPDESDADLVNGSDAVDLPSGGIWKLPSRAACVQCHTEAAKRSLGPELRQLERAVTWPQTGITANQPETFAHIGLFASSPPTATALPALLGPAPLEDRARAWLHVNCASCHRPGGGTEALLDLRVTTPLGSTGLCEAPVRGDLGIPGALVVTPGDPSLSVLSARIGSEGAYRMPPVGTDLVDPDGQAVIDGWIAGMTSCP